MATRGGFVGSTRGWSKSKQIHESGFSGCSDNVRGVTKTDLNRSIGLDFKEGSGPNAIAERLHYAHPETMDSTLYRWTSFSPSVHFFEDARLTVRPDISS